MKFSETCSSTVIHTWSAMKIYFQIYSTKLESNACYREGNFIYSASFLHAATHAAIQQFMVLYRVKTNPSRALKTNN